MAFCAVAGTSCQDYVFEQKCPEGITEAQVTVPAAVPTPADILFVVDNSASMADEQENLARNFEFFINQVAGSGDYRIAIVTTDQRSDGGERQGLVSIEFDEGEYRNLLDIDGAACETTNIPHGCFRGPDPATRIIDSMTMTREEQVIAFQNNVRVGSCGSGTEEGLLSMRVALDQTQAGGCNAGFLRPEANLVVVLVSDEQDASEERVSQFVQDLIAVKDATQIRVAAIIGSVDGRGSDCSINEGSACGTICQDMPAAGSQMSCTPGQQNTCPAGEYCNSQGRFCENEQLRYWTPSFCKWCSYYDVADCCSALAGDRYIDFARAIEARVVDADPAIEAANCRAPIGQAAACLVDSICQDNFGETLERIARELVITDKYTLDPAATNPDGVSVRVVGGRFGEAGVDLVAGEDFTVTEDGRTLRIGGEKTPGPDEDLQVAYVTEISRPTEQKGACGPNTSTSALSLQ